MVPREEWMCRMQIKGVSLMRRIKIAVVLLNLSTLRSVCIFFILFFIHFLWCWQGELNTRRELILSLAFSFILVTELGGCLSQGRWLPTSRNDNGISSLSFEKMFLPEDEYTNIGVDIIYKSNLASFHHWIVRARAS